MARDNTVRFQKRTLQRPLSRERPGYAGVQVVILEEPGGRVATARWTHQGWPRSSSHPGPLHEAAGTLPTAPVPIPGPSPSTASASTQEMLSSPVVSEDDQPSRSMIRRPMSGGNSVTGETDFSRSVRSQGTLQFHRSQIAGSLPTEVSTHHGCLVDTGTRLGCRTGGPNTLPERPCPGRGPDQHHPPCRSGR